MQRSKTSALFDHLGGAVHHAGMAHMRALQCANRNLSQAQLIFDGGGTARKYRVVG
jgi:hypothetical protein